MTEKKGSGQPHSLSSAIGTDHDSSDKHLGEEIDSLVEEALRVTDTDLLAKPTAGESTEGYWAEATSDKPAPKADVHADERNPDVNLNSERDVSRVLSDDETIEQSKYEMEQEPEPVVDDLTLNEQLAADNSQQLENGPEQEDDLFERVLINDATDTETERNGRSPSFDDQLEQESELELTAGTPELTDTHNSEQTPTTTDNAATEHTEARRLEADAETHDNATSPDVASQDTPDQPIKNHSPLVNATLPTGTENETSTDEYKTPELVAGKRSPLRIHHMLLVLVVLSAIGAMAYLFNNTGQESLPTAQRQEVHEEPQDSNNLSLQTPPEEATTDQTEAILPEVADTDKDSHNATKAQFDAETVQSSDEQLNLTTTTPQSEKIHAPLEGELVGHEVQDTIKTESESMENEDSGVAQLNNTLTTESEKPRQPNWVVNLSSYSTRSSAESEQKRLRALGVEAIVRQTQVDEKTWFRVSIEGFSSREAAENYIQNQLDRTTPGEAWVSENGL